MEIAIKHIDDEYEKEDGKRILVDRLWPRGVSKQEAKVHFWYKWIAPSEGIDEWLALDRAERFEDYTKLYLRELKQNESMIDARMPKVKVTLITGSKRFESSHVPTLKTFLEELK